MEEPPITIKRRRDYPPRLRRGAGRPATRSPAAARIGSPSSRPTRSPAPASTASRSASTRSSATTSRSPTPTPTRCRRTIAASRPSRTPSATKPPELKEHEEKVIGAEEKIQQSGIRIVRGAARARRRSDAAAACRPPRCWPRSTCWRRWRSWPSSRGYCRPELVDEPMLEIGDGRHPVLDQMLPPGTFVPNDVILGGDHGFCADHRPQHGGQKHRPAPGGAADADGPDGQLRAARRRPASASPTASSRALERSDDLSRGQSTFMVEMTEAANILNNATQRAAW